MPSELIVKSKNGELLFHEEISSHWLMSDQVKDVERWFKEYDIERPRNSMCYIDVGIENRINERNDIAIQGETISASLMKLLGEKDIDLWITIYPEIKNE